MKKIHTLNHICVVNNVDETEIFLKEAVDTLRRLPSQSLRAKLSSWPDVVQRSAEVFSTIPNFIRPAAPSPSAIDRLDYLLHCLVKLNEQERRLIWARASNVSWRKLEHYENLSHTTLRKYHKTGIEKLFQYLKNENQY